MLPSLCFLFVVFFAPNIGTLLAGEVLPRSSSWCLLTLTTVYATEISPLALKALSYNIRQHLLEHWEISGKRSPQRICERSNLMVLSGSLCHSMDVASIIMIAALFAPESPW